MSTTGQPMETESRLVLARGLEKGQREATAGEYGDSFLGDENILKSAVIMVNKPVNILKPAELHTLKGDSYACE